MRFNNKNGTAIVEFAIIFPITMLLFLGIIEFSIILFDKAVITNASREGTRAGIVQAPTRLTDQEIRDIVKNYCNNYLLWNKTIADGDIEINRSGFSFGDDLIVIVRYQYNFIALPGFMTTPLGPINLVAWTTMRME